MAVALTADGAISKAEGAARRARRSWAVTVWTGRVLLLVAVLVLWQTVSGRLVDATFLSRPTEIASAWWRLAQNGLLLGSLQVTLTEFVIGFLAGAAAGLVLAAALTVADWPYRLLEPYVLAIYGVPKVALAPLFVLWFGIDLLPKVLLVAMMTFFLVFMNTVAGVRSVNRQMVDVMRVMGARTPALYRLVVLPHALPFALTAMRISIPTAMVGAVLGEFLGAGAGIGYLIYQASNNLDTAQMFGLIATLALMVLVFRLLLLPVEAWVNRFQTVVVGGGVET